jgi:uncharacterized protein (DUF1684 family)
MCDANRSPADPALNSQSGIQDAYTAEISAARKSRDEEFRSRHWSPLAVIAVARLDRPRIVIGSGKEVDLSLPAENVADIHAEILRREDPSEGVQWILQPVNGEIWSDADPPEPIEGMLLKRGSRAKIDRFIIYHDTIGTLGSVVRALDYSSPSYTKFTGLSYYPPDPEYRVEALVTPYPEIERVTVSDTHGWQRVAWRYGDVSFTLNGYKLRLVLMLFTPEPGPEDTFFIAFTDETKGIETYPAARYLTTPFVTSGPMTLDFNLATNPSCAYNRGFACPLPPWENRLPLEIRAGEKIYPNSMPH